MLLALPIALLALGIALYILGRRGIAIDDHPICKRCRYDLHAIPLNLESAEQTRCPECGASVSFPGAIRTGNRRQRARLIVCGISLTLLAVFCYASLAIFAVNPTTLNQHKPVWLLTLQARYSTTKGVNAALDELIDRQDNGRLSPQELAKTISVALTIQGQPDKPWNTRWGDIIEAAHGRASLSETDWSRYARQAITLKPRARSPMRVGDPYAIQIDSESRAGSDSVLLAGALCGYPQGTLPTSPPDYVFYGPEGDRASSPRTSTTILGYANGFPVARNQAIGWDAARPSSTGPRKLIIPAMIYVMDDAGTIVPRAKRWRHPDDQQAAKFAGTAFAAPLNILTQDVNRWIVLLHVDTLVVERSTPVITLRKSPEDDAAMRRRLTQLGFRLNRPTSSNRKPYASLQLPEFPDPVAFDVLWKRPNGTTKKLCTIVSDGHLNDHAGAYIDQDNAALIAKELSTNTITLTFRPNPAAIYSHIDVKSIHGTEITLENHPITPTSYDY